MARGTFTFEGKRYDITANTEKELIEKIALRKRDLEEGRKKITRNMTVDDWFNVYMPTYKLTSVSAATYKDLLGFYKNWIRPVMGSLSIKNVRPVHCQIVLNNMLGKGKSAISKVFQLMNGMFQAACDNNLLLENPMRGIKMPPAEDGTHRSISDMERAVILKVADLHKYGLWVKVLLYCGLRPGETERILGNHIDLTKKILYIDGTKSKSAKRYVPIPDILVQDLMSVDLKPFQYVFTNQWGGTINRTNRRRMWDSFKRAMNIEMGCKTFRGEVLPPYAVAEDLVPYCLRHTYCTDLQSAGVPINVAKEFMGHSDISITSKIYTHSSELSFTTAANAINKMHCGITCGSDTQNH